MQAGVGGLAAAIIDRLRDWMARPAVSVVVEPERCACVATALAAGGPVRLQGEFDTAAEMLSCGEASAPAVAVLRRHGAQTIAVTEAVLAAAPLLLRAAGGPATTPSGAAGLAGLAAVIGDAESRSRFRLGSDGRVLLIVSEGPARRVPRRRNGFSAL